MSNCEYGEFSNVVTCTNDPELLRMLGDYKVEIKYFCEEHKDEFVNATDYKLNWYVRARKLPFVIKEKRQIDTKDCEEHPTDEEIRKAGWQ